jgi:hypothetical protein
VGAPLGGLAQLTHLELGYVAFAEALDAMLRSPACLSCV